MKQDKQDNKEAPKMQEQEMAPAQEPLQEDTQAQLPMEEEAEYIDVEKLLTDLEEARKQSDEYLNLAQRVQADFENYRRRNNAARAEAFDEGAVSLAKTLLPVIDNLERALDASSNTCDTALRDGVMMVYRLLSEAFEKRGIEAISRPGEKFDPALENAVMTASREEGEPGTVCEVLQKGYKLDKCVLRHAMVRVVEE
jgi:molecular chaperone GrpE